jgi:DNA-binding transcriptional LysR family regulator
MQINQLLHFVTVIEKESYTAASYALHISQPSLSTSIKRLEDELGFKLIDRSQRKLKLTKEGELLYKESKKLIMHFNQVCATAFKLKENGPPILSIGLIESAKYWTAQVVKEYRSLHEEVFIELEPVLSLDDIKQAFDEFEVHVAIINQYINDDSITCIPLYEEKLVAVFHLDNHLEKKTSLNISDLRNEELIISKEGYQTRTDILKSFNKSGISPNIKYEIGRYDFVSDFVKIGLGTAIMPEKYAQSLDDTVLNIREIDDSDTIRTVYLAYDNKRFLSSLTRSFINLVLKNFNKKPLSH